jgi:hypothetical protein
MKERIKVALDDYSGNGNHPVFELNWNKLAKKKGFLRIEVGGVECVVSKEQLWTILFMLGNANEQEALVSPFVKQTPVTKFTKMIGVTAEKDIPKGGMLNVLLEITYEPETNTMRVGKGSLTGLRRGKVDIMKPPKNY